jgi:hypothetical protein
VELPQLLLLVLIFGFFVGVVGPQSGLFHDDGILDSLVQVFGLLFALFDLHHGFLEINRYVFTILENRIDLPYVDLFVPDLFHALLPLLGLLKLLLEHHHFLGDVFEAELLLVETDQITHFKLFFLGDIDATFALTHRNIAFPLNFLGEFYTLADFFLNI